MIKPIEEALKKVSNRFLLTTVVSRRWENIVAGAPPLVPVRPDMTKVDVVLAEINEGLIVVDNEAQVIRITGQPEVEETEETLFSEAISPDAMGVQEALGSDE